MLFELIFTTLSLSCVSARFVSPPTDLTTKEGYAGISVRYKDVPNGICELDDSVLSIAGYADVGEDEHLFFWFFESRTVHPHEAPLTVWINGGPGSSSMIGLFQENGPCRISSTGDVEHNPYSWSNVSTMLFIDEPVGVGLSYTKAINGYNKGNNFIALPPNASCPSYAAQYGGCLTASYPNATLTANSTAAAAPNMWKALQGFMGAFPSYARHGFHFATESYGGHYGPIFNEYFEQQNVLDIQEAHKISLESVAIGNGWYDPPIHYQAFYNFTVFPGNSYDLDVYNSTQKEQLYNNLYGSGNCLDQINYCQSNGGNAVCSLADNFCANEVESLLGAFPKRDEYDIRELTPDPFPPKYYVKYLNTPAVQKAIGAYVHFSSSSRFVGSTFSNTGDDGRVEGTIDAVRELLAQNVSVTMYAGDADYNCNWLGGEVVAEEVSAPGFSSAGYTNITTSDGIVNGQVKQAANFAFARIYYSGHEVPFYQPLLALELFNRTMLGLDIATGTVSARIGSSYVSEGTAKSEFREGNRTVQYHVLPVNSTYDVVTGAPSVVGNETTARLHSSEGDQHVVQGTEDDEHQKVL